MPLVSHLFVVHTRTRTHARTHTHTHTHTHTKRLILPADRHVHNTSWYRCVDNDVIGFHLLGPDVHETDVKRALTADWATSKTIPKVGGNTSAEPKICASSRMPQKTCQRHYLTLSFTDTECNSKWKQNDYWETLSCNGEQFSLWRMT